MASPVFRKLALAGLAVFAAAALMILSLPLLASTSLIRDRITQEVGSLAGHRITIGEAPHITLFPDIRVRLKAVRMLGPGQGNTPLLKADELEVSLSALAAVSGRIEFTAMRLVRPVLFLDPDTGMTLEAALPRTGHVGKAIARVSRQLSDARNKGKTKDIPGRSIGTIEIVDGRVASADKDEGKLFLSALNGKLVWPRLNAPLTLAMSGIWNGESLSVEGAVAQPVLLLAGGLSDVELSLSSPLLIANYDGTLNRLPSLHGDGQLSLQSTAPSRAAEWLKLPFIPGISPGPTGMKAAVSGDAGRLKLDDAAFSGTDVTAKGALEISFTADVPQIAGALDFDFLDLDALMAAFTSPPPETMTSNERIEAKRRLPIGLDVRLSAATATLASLSMEKVASTVQVKDGLAVLDISDATAFGGVVQAGLRLSSESWPYTGELRVLATDIDGKAVGDAMGRPNRFPSGTGTISLILEGKARTWRQLLEQSSGSFSAKFIKGSIPDLDAGAFRKQMEARGFFGLQLLEGDVFPFDVAELEAELNAGAATIQKAEIRNSDNLVRLTGVIPYADRSLALSGTLGPSAPAQEPDPASDPATGDEIRFFVGGSWSSPFITPILATPLHHP
ncbi:MAG: AsmA family protein [Notoacmeibacter sp.]|nr:AsmA family protein [Notoacmeibacter sp.]MCC0032514.1 AsmA family protein [Brucellaceae bacterium]